MTTLFLSTTGGALGSSFLGPIGKFAGAQLGTYVGARLDSIIFGLDKTLPLIRPPHLGDLNVQTSTYGKVIPIIYGSAKIAGNIIWATPLKEVREESTVGKFGPRTTKVTATYYATLAIAICKGVANELINIYANEQILDRKSLKYRFYRGIEDQQPDYLIQEIEGKAPAYRGTCYIVLEDFPLAEYGNRIPNFTFEISCNVNSPVTQKIQSINIIPGSGEFVYDPEIQSKSQGEYFGETWLQSGQATRINQNSSQNVADAVLALEQMEKTLPNLKWVSVVINWFCDDLDIGKCAIYPAVEYQGDGKSIPEDWHVAGITRRTARLISRDDQDRPSYGGTISDNSLMRYLKELKNRGYKILIYPMLLLDIKGKPWRGKITGKHQDLEIFFPRYNKFITHYAELTKDLADGFIIGSEFKGITQIQENGEYHAVTEFTKLAKVIKEILSKKTIVTYAANWDEYHSHNGDYYMDQLWSSPYIDVVGIDSYFPLTDRIQPPLGFSREEIIKGWSSGEGYDYFYQDSENHTGKTDYENFKWAWKNIQKWWEEEHLTTSGKKTPWQPKMKKIWFTEYGFPSVDGCSNQPNVFIDKSSEESRFPFFSRGNIDFKAQAVAIEGTLDKWFGSDMVENMFLWAWDARPFPYFPNLLSVWNDGLSWEFSHEVQGKLFFPTLSSIISDIMLKANYKKSDFDSTKLTQLVEGFILNESYNAKSALEILQQAYLFDVVVEGKKIIFHPKFTDTKAEIKADDLVPVNNSSFAITRSSDVPSKIEVLYLSKMRNYELSSTYSELNSSDKVVKTFFLPLILSDHHAKAISSILLYHYWQSRTKYTLNLPLNWIRLSPADVIKFSTATTQHVIKITSIDEGSVLQVSGISHDNSIYDVGADNFTTSDPPLNNFSGKTEFEILDLPTNNEGISIAKYGREKNWKGAVLSVSNDEGRSFEATTNLEGNTILGICLSNLPDGPYSITDEGSEVIVILTNGELESITEEALLSGGNLAKIGEEILQFRNAEFISENKYKLSGFLRGRFGSENYVDKHDSQEKFILLNNLVDSIPLEDNSIGRKRLYQATSYGEIEGESKEFIYRNNYLKPFSVVHISGTKDEIGNIIIRWIRRSRIESDLRDYVDVPLGEEFEKYDVEIFQDSRLVRNFSVENSTTLTYPLEEQLNDLGTSPDELDIKIYQLSAIVGRGISEITQLIMSQNRPHL